MVLNTQIGKIIIYVGVLLKNELAEMLHMCFNGITDAHVNEIFESMDIDHDQEITYEEFLTYIRKNKQRSVLLSQVLKPIFEALSHHTNHEEKIKPLKLQLTESKHNVLRD